MDIVGRARRLVPIGMAAAALLYAAAIVLRYRGERVVSALDVIAMLVFGVGALLYWRQLAARRRRSRED